MAVIDTSASMDEVLLIQISGELGRMARDFEVVVVECDAKIQACYPYRGSIQSVRGRGGTDLRPPFAAPFLAKIGPDVVSCFTDGRGPAPEKPPRMPTVWCLPPDGVRPASWGRIIRLGAPPQIG
jgi:predicted metal-dependent peptidase